MTLSLIHISNGVKVIIKKTDFKADEIRMKGVSPVSYTHLDVYKRQAPFIEEQYLRFNRYPIRRRFDAMADYMLDMLKIQYRCV